MWSSYINSEIKELTRLGKDKKQFEFVNMLGKKLIIYNYTSKATVNDARYKVSRIVKLVEIVEIKYIATFISTMP